MDPATADPALLSCYVLLTLGLSLAIIVPDRNTPTTRALAAALALTVVWTIPYFVVRAMGLTPLVQAWPLELVPGELAQIAAAEWFLRVLRTAPRDGWSRSARPMLRVVQLCQLPTIFLRLKYADVFDQASGLIQTPGPIPPGIVTLFVTLAVLSGSLFLLAMLILLFRKADLSERQRVISIAAVMPFFIVSNLLRDQITLWITLRVLGLLIGLVGIMRYLAMQGQRSEFLARFLSPQVRDQVRSQGLMQALDSAQLELTVVCCDLRGFTAYSQVNPSKQVAGVLQRYFAAVSAAATQYGGTIKDFAGDGVLLLVGAPVALPDHAQRGLALARRAREAVLKVLHESGTQSLGVGFGVASGVVTVGAIDAASRLEYMAVGPAVNLAARLCSLAADGDILVSDRTAELAGAGDLAPRTPVAIKGFGDSIPHFSAERAPTPA